MPVRSRLVSTHSLPLTSTCDFVVRIWALNLIPNSLLLSYPLYFPLPPISYCSYIYFKLFFISLHAALNLCETEEKKKEEREESREEDRERERLVSINDDKTDF